eukprot:7170619-Prymnesium_polylepis.1
MEPTLTSPPGFVLRVQASAKVMNGLQCMNQEGPRPSMRTFVTHEWNRFLLQRRRRWLLCHCAAPAAAPGSPAPARAAHPP